VLYGFHHLTNYVMRTRQGTSEPYSPEVGFREGCSTSPGLYNGYHNEAMRDFMGRCGAREGNVEDERVRLHSLEWRCFSTRVRKEPGIRRGGRRRGGE
jgi:hypothetical protein